MSIQQQENQSLIWAADAELNEGERQKTKRGKGTITTDDSKALDRKI